MATALDEALERARLLLEAITRGEYCCLRHGLPYVTPSILAGQAFCEARTDFEMRLASSESKPSPSTARRLIQVLLGAKRRLWGRDSGVLSVPLAAVLHGVPVVGSPPVLVAEGGCVRAIYAVSQTRSKKLYMTHRVKIYAYALLAEELGIMCSNARLAYILAEEPLDAAELVKSLPEPAHPRPLETRGATLHLLAHDPVEEERLLEPLLAYWRGEREPRPRRGPWCSGCPYRVDCFSLYPSREPWPRPAPRG